MLFHSRQTQPERACSLGWSSRASLRGRTGRPPAGLGQADLPEKGPFYHVWYPRACAWSTDVVRDLVRCPKALPHWLVSLRTAGQGHASFW